MFEKEAEYYAFDEVKHKQEWYIKHPEHSIDCDYEDIKKHWGKGAEFGYNKANEKHSPDEHIDKDRVVLGIIKHCNKTRYSLVQWNGEWWYQYGTYNAEVRLIAWYNIPELPKGDCMKNEYADFLKHLGINKDLMLSDMQSRLPDYEKNIFIKRCKDFEVCESVKSKGCKGCNVWNYLYDIKALQKWCKEHNEDFMQFTMKMHKMLKERE